VVALQLTNQQQSRKKELGTVWIDCPRVLPKLRTALESQAAAVEYFDGEPRPQREDNPSLIVVCVDDKEAVSKKVKRLRTLVPKTPILAFISSSSVLCLAEEALRAGAHGFVHAGMRPERIAMAISAVAEDVVLIPRELVGDLLGRRLFLRLPKFLDP
jgi:DNA-binding NarL/FixJ family response regulator